MNNIAQLNIVADVFNGKTPSKAEQRNDGHPVLKIKDVSEKGRFNGDFGSFVDKELAEKFAKKQVKKGDILILNAAHNADYVGSKVYRAENEVVGSLATGEWLIIRPSSKNVDPSYVYYWVMSGETKYRMRRLVKGIHLYPKDVSLLNIQLPPLPEQKRIVAILDKADTIRRKRQLTIKKNEDFLRSLFLDMFGDPVTNPKGWPVVKLESICKRITDGTHQPPKWTDQGVPFLFISNVVQGRLTYDTKKFISEETLEELTKRCPIEINDVLYTTVGSYGNAALVNSDKKFCFQRHIAHLKPDCNKVLPRFLWVMLNNPGVKRQADRQARGIAQKTLNLRELKEFDVFCPPLQNQKQFIEIAHCSLKNETNNKVALEISNRLFNSLTHLAFSGELTNQTADELLKEAVAG